MKIDRFKDFLKINELKRETYISAANKLKKIGQNSRADELIRHSDHISEQERIKKIISQSTEFEAIFKNGDVSFKSKYYSGVDLDLCYDIWINTDYSEFYLNIFLLFEVDNNMFYFSPISVDITEINEFSMKIGHSGFADGYPKIDKKLDYINYQPLKLTNRKDANEFFKLFKDDLNNSLNRFLLKNDINDPEIRNFTNKIHDIMHNLNPRYFYD
jgi:hypothetical protein